MKLQETFVLDNAIDHLSLSGIGVDDMLQLLVGWRKTVSQGERLSGTLRSAAVSITITSLTDLLAFCIGATSPFLSVRNFCACSGI